MQEDRIAENEREAQGGAGAATDSVMDPVDGLCRGRGLRVSGGRHGRGGRGLSHGGVSLKPQWAVQEDRIAENEREMQWWQQILSCTLWMGDTIEGSQRENWKGRQEGE